MLKCLISSSRVRLTIYPFGVCVVVAFGSEITLKNRRGGGGLLHSHAHLYPEEYGEFQQQQVLSLCVNHYVKVGLEMVVKSICSTFYYVYYMYTYAANLCGHLYQLHPLYCIR